MKRITKSDEIKKALDELTRIGEGVLFVGMNGCPFCKKAEEDLKDWENAVEVEVNPDTYDFIKALDVKSTPTFFVIKNGKIVRRVIGYADTVKEYILGILRGEIP